MGDNFFAPQEITVVVGATVTWQINQGENNHDVVSTDGLFHSNVPMTRGVDMFMYTFTKPGEYSYVCSFHIPEGMTGKIIVK
jgi:plastocyanin